MNDAYTIYFRGQAREYRWGEPMLATRRSLKWLLEERFHGAEHSHSPDAIMMEIDANGQWEDDLLKVERGHVERNFDETIQEIQRQLATDGVVYVEYANDNDYKAVLKLVRTGEFRYDRYWKNPTWF